jgi:hypothetical protein
MFLSNILSGFLSGLDNCLNLCIHIMFLLVNGGAYSRMSIIFVCLCVFVIIRVLQNITGKWNNVALNGRPDAVNNRVTYVHLIFGCTFYLKRYVTPLLTQTLTGTSVHVNEKMARFTNDVIATCAIGINGNSLKAPDAEFGWNKEHIPLLCEKGLAMLTAFFAPYLKALFNLIFVDNKTKNYIKNAVWSTVEYRWVSFSYLFYFSIIDLAQVKGRWRALLNRVMNLRVPQNKGNFLTSTEPIFFSWRTLLRGVLCINMQSNQYVQTNLNVNLTWINSIFLKAGYPV